MMVRKQIQLKEEQAAKLKKLAATKGVHKIALTK